jgi:hypothetical protein
MAGVFRRKYVRHALKYARHPHYVSVPLYMPEGTPDLPAGLSYLVDEAGAFLLNSSGAYLVAATS